MWEVIVAFGILAGIVWLWPPKKLGKKPLFETSGKRKIQFFCREIRSFDIAEYQVSKDTYATDKAGAIRYSLNVWGHASELYQGDDEVKQPYRLHLAFSPDGQDDLEPNVIGYGHFESEHIQVNLLLPRDVVRDVVHEFRTDAEKVIRIDGYKSSTKGFRVVHLALFPKRETL
jgi:hypothetical protein